MNTSITTTEPISVSTAIAGVLVTGVALLAVFLPGLDPTTQALIIAFGNSLILAGSVIWSRRQVFTKPSVQALADSATYLPAGTTVDIGAPPEGNLPASAEDSDTTRTTYP